MHVSAVCAGLQCCVLLKATPLPFPHVITTGAQPAPSPSCSQAGPPPTVMGRHGGAAAAPPCSSLLRCSTARSKATTAARKAWATAQGEGVSRSLCGPGGDWGEHKYSHYQPCHSHITSHAITHITSHAITHITSHAMLGM